MNTDHISAQFVPRRCGRDQGCMWSCSRDGVPIWVPFLYYYLEEVVCGRLGRRAREDGGCPPWWFPLGGEVGGAAALNLARVGAFADELRLMGVERAEVSTLVGRRGGGRGSLSVKVSRACGPPAIERMWSGP